MFNKKCTKLVAAMGLTLSAGVAQAAMTELAVNGDFETGDTSGWTTFLDPPNNGSFTATTVQSNGGIYSGNLVADTSVASPSFPVVKQANVGAGLLVPGQAINVSFDLFGSVSGSGGVFFAEGFSELSGGGTSASEIFGGGPLFPNGTWTTYNFTHIAGPDISGGFTLQLKTDCGANPGCVVDAYIDNVSIMADVNPVPVPAAVWLFGSGLLGLIGVARRKKALAA